MSNTVNNYGGIIPEPSRQVRNSEGDVYSPQNTVSQTRSAAPVENGHAQNPDGGQPPVNINICTYGNSACYPSFYYTSQPGGAGISLGKVRNSDSPGNALLKSSVNDEEGSPAMSRNSHGPYPYGAPANGGFTEEQFERLLEALSKGKADKDGKEKKISTLTSGYIKTLENYLRSDNIDLRKMAAQQVIARFEEKDSRRDNPSLTALLNLMLQDPDSTVRACGIALIAGGAARGNDQSIMLLENLSKSDKNHGTEATSAASALLTASANIEKVKDTQ